MKRRIYKWNSVVWVACIALLAVSCADTDAGITNNTNLAVQFTPQLKGHVAGSEALHPGTRAVDTKWSADDKVGIYMLADGGSLPANAMFSQYQVSGAGESVGLVPTAADQTLYYPANGDDVNFIAFSPYVEQSNNKVTYSGFADQSEQSKMEAVDVLYSNSQEAFNRTNTSASLTFNHAMSKLVIKVTTTNAASEKIDLRQLIIGATGLPSSVSLDLSDGTLEAGSTKTAVQLFHTNGSDERIATAIVVPHAGAGSRSITFTLGSEDGNSAFSSSLLETYDFASGKMYVMEFLATKQGVTLTNTESYDWAEGYIIWDDEYVLSVEETMKYVVMGSNTIEFKTNNTGVTPTITYSTSATDVDAGAPSWVTHGTLVTSNKTEYTLHTVSFNVDTPSADPFYIHITVGELKVVVEVRMMVADSANCVMLPTDGANVLIPVSRANEYTDLIGAATPAIGDSDTFTTEVLWSDTDGLLTPVSTVGTGSDGYILVTTASGKSGNAVVAVKVNDEIKWSWHIWVVDYDPSAVGATYTNAQAEFMDRNLGATAAGYSTDATNSAGTHGLYYQWGRKDPFPSTLDPGELQPGGGSFTVVLTSKTLGTVDNTIKNPSVFLGGLIGSSNDWYYGDGAGKENRNNTLWDNSGDKTIYDPCPAGWRVSVNSWAGFFASNGTKNNPFNGWSWGTNAIYPAAGHRNYSTGEFENVGTHGDYWYGLVFDAAYMRYFHFSSTDVYEFRDNGRSCGFSVRCVASQN